MNPIPFLDLKAQYASIRTEVEAAVGRVLDDASFVLGPRVAEFEERFAAYCGRKHCVAVNSGTSALHLALLVAGVGPGDEVVTTPHTWISTSWAVSYCGAKPVFADVDPATGNLDPDLAERAIGPRTKAILPVDLYGGPADLAEFEAIAQRAGIPLIEDAAQAHGASIGSRKCGSFGQLSCFSFYPGKNLGAMGEGGAVLTDDLDLATRMRRLRDHAQVSRHRHVECGFNYRMEAIQGAVLSVKLSHLDRWNDGRTRAAQRYVDLLAKSPGVRLPSVAPGARSSWHLFVVRLGNRDQVMSRMTEAGIGVAVHYPTPVHLQPAYGFLGQRPGSLPEAESFAAECLSLPMYPEITREQQSRVAQVLVEAVASV